LLPELNYGDLDGVQNGCDAQLAWMQTASAGAEERKLGISFWNILNWIHWRW